MKVLFWMNIGFEAHTTSEHLLSAVIEQLAKAGHSVHVIQMIPNESLPVLPQSMCRQHRNFRHFQHLNFPDWKRHGFPAFWEKVLFKRN